MYWAEDVDSITVPRKGLAARIGNAYARLISKLGLGDFSFTQGTDCYLTFDADGKKLEFHVPRQCYLSLEEGMRGMLVYRGEQFKQFTPLNDSDPGQLEILR